MDMKENKGGRPIKQSSPFNNVFRLLTSSETQQVSAKKIGTTRQNVGRWLNSKNPTTPDIVTLSKIADAYNVSTDYLLGRTPVKTADVDKKRVCDLTGLSQDAVEELIRLRKYEDDSFYPYGHINQNNHLQMMDLINILIGRRYETTNLDEENVSETYFSLIMQAALQYIEIIYDYPSEKSRTDKLLNNAAKWEAIEIFKDFLDGAAEQIAKELKGDQNNGNS